MEMSASLWKSAKKTNIKHNNRKQDEYDNKEIDQARFERNKYLVQENIKEIYHREFGESLERYNAKQKRKDRKIDDYYEHVARGKKTNPQQEIIVQVGSGFRGADYGYGDDNWNKTNEILEEYFSEFERRNPNLKVYNAVIHNDETSPHLHINFVPVASGYKRGLEKQVAFDRAVKQQDEELNVSHPFEAWKLRELSVVEELMNERGIKRKEVGTNEYEDTNELKEVTQRLRELEIKVEAELEKLDILEEGAEDRTDEPETIVVDIDYKPMPKVEMGKTITGRSTIDPDTVKELEEYALYQKEQSNRYKKELNKRNEDYSKLRKIYLRDHDQLEEVVEDRVFSKRQNWARERLNYDRELYNLSEGVKSLKKENKAFNRENKVLREWKDKAINFMKKIKVYDKFQKIISRGKSLAKNEVER